MRVAEPCGLHAHSLAQLGHDPADGAHTDDPNFFPLKLKGLSGVPDLPVSLAELGVCLQHVFGQGKHGGHRMLGH